MRYKNRTENENLNENIKYNASIIDHSVFIFFIKIIQKGKGYQNDTFS